MKHEENISTVIPDYNTACSNCGQTPTVTIKNKYEEKVNHLELCGPCAFGEAAAIDPDNW